ncbi:MAG TPA: hypothetical protein VMS93_01730 [Candidatus Saccharimonadales bacterium]|nr:hypothetical protein [Candidatus Saccharimonadales bacterium]
MLAIGCGWLSTAPPAPPAQGVGARPVPLDVPESTLANIQEAFRVGSVSAYMRSIAAPGGGTTVDFTATFNGSDVSQRGMDHAVVGAWHSTQERNAANSMMNGLSPTDAGADTRAVVTKTVEYPSSGDQRDWLVTYRVNIRLYNAPYVAGQARLLLQKNFAGEWQILNWDEGVVSQTPAPAVSWSVLRYANHS